MATDYMLAPGTTAEDLALRRRMALELMRDAGDASPVQHPVQAIARVVRGVMGGLQMRKAREEDEGERASGRKMMTDFLMGGGPPASLPSDSGSVSTASTAGKIYEADEPSPLDPPSGKERDLLIRTMFAEAGSQPPEGQQAVANVVRNRAVAGDFGGDTAGSVITKPWAFEPTMTPQGRERMASLDPNSAKYSELGAGVDRAYAGDDPTQGATHFYAPKAQAALGRPTPSWARGQGQDIGDHRFYGGAAEKPIVLADASAVAQGAATGATTPNREMLIQMLQNRHTAPIAQGIVGKQFEQQFVPKPPSYEKLNDDTLYEKGSGRTMSVGSGYRPITDPAERARFGIPADDKRPYQVGPAGKLINPPPETRVTVGQQGESEFSKKAAGLSADRFNDLVKSGDTAREAVANLENLREIGSRITTGKTAEMQAALGPYAEAAGIKIDKLGDLQAYNSIVAKMAPSMRVPGSGATSDFEMRQYLEGLPGLGKTPEGNKLIADTNQAILEHRMKAAEIGSRALSGEITAREAEKELRALPDPLALWKKHRGSTPAGGKSNSGTTRGGLQWSVQ